MRILLLFFFIGIGGAGWAWDFSLRAGTLFFDPQLEASLAGSPLAGTALNLLGSAGLEHSYPNGLGFSLGFEQDPLFEQRCLTRIGFYSKYFTLQAGLFFNILNFPNVVTIPGLSLGLKGAVPGRVFGSVSLDSTVGQGLNGSGAYALTRFELEGGFWLSFARLSLNFNAGSFAGGSDSAFSRKERTRYGFTVDFYEQGFPLTIGVSGGYQELHYSLSGSQNTVYQINSFYAGFAVGYQLRPAARLVLSGELPVYSWLSHNFHDELVMETRPVLFTDFIYYEVTLGITWSLTP
jgi:hypothetical protein